MILVTNNEGTLGVPTTVRMGQYRGSTVYQNTVTDILSGLRCAILEPTKGGVSGGQALWPLVLGPPKSVS